MGDTITTEMRAELGELGRRIDAKFAELKSSGILHGAERAARADAALRELELAQLARHDGKKLGALAADLEALRLTLERWLARVDAGAELHDTPRRTGVGKPRAT